MSQAQSSSGICPRCYSLGPPETTLPPPQRGMCFRWISGDISFVMTSGSNLGGRNLAGNVTVGYCVPTLGNPIVQVMQHRRQSDSPRSVVGLGPDGLQAGNVTKGITARGCGSGPRFTCAGQSHRSASRRTPTARTWTGSRDGRATSAGGVIHAYFQVRLRQDPQLRGRASHDSDTGCHTGRQAGRLGCQQSRPAGRM